MKRIILAALVGVLAVGRPAWADLREVEDCEVLIKEVLKFPGSYKKEYVIWADRPEVVDKDGKNLGKVENTWTVKIEFTVKDENNQALRRVGQCTLQYEKGSLFAIKKLIRATSNVKIKYD